MTDPQAEKLRLFANDIKRTIATEFSPRAEILHRIAFAMVAAADEIDDRLNYLARLSDEHYRTSLAVPKDPPPGQ